MAEEETFKRILEYGNTFYGLYYTPATIPGTEEAPTIRICVDDKLTFFGDAAVKYDIIYENAAGQITIVSTTYNTSGEITGHVGTIVGITDNKKCVACYSEYDIYEGSKYTLRVYDAMEKIIATYELIAVKATDLIGTGETKHVVKFIVRADETDSSGNPVIYQGDTPKLTKFHPYLIYNTGEEAELNIETQCTVFGFDEISTDVAGLTYNVIVKYFTDIEKGEFLITDFDVTIAKRDLLSYYAKFITVPVVSSMINKCWHLCIYGLKHNQTDAPDKLAEVDESGTWVSGGTITGFNGIVSDNPQPQNITTTITTTGLTYSENCILTVYDPNVVDNTKSIFTIKDNNDSLYTYGIPTADNLLPVIDYYNEGTGITNPGYYIWYNLDCGETEEDRTEAFLQHFYWYFNPPYDPVNKTEADTPEVFTLRDLNTGKTIINDPIPVANFKKILANLGTINTYVNHTLLMEFLKDEIILCAVPVFVRKK